jgi:hypothetical protein
VFVLGLDDLNREVLERLPLASELRFHQLLTVERLQHGEDIPLRSLLEEATARLDAFDGPIDAIVGYWDFPVSSMVPLLARRYGVRAAPLESVLRCEHKYWSRLVQAEVAPEACPRFALVDPDDPDAGPPTDVPTPYWLKPVKSFSSGLAYRIEDEQDFREALAGIREGIGRVGEPFSHVLGQADLPPEIAEIGGAVCVAEEEARGMQVTIEGYAVDGEVHVYGAFDSISFEHVPSFLRFQYPSRLPTDVTQRMADISRRVIAASGLEPSTFNVEFFWHAETDALTLLEINPRHSQSHAKLVAAVDGVANHQIMVDLALGREPVLPTGDGVYDVAAKWFLKHFDDATVTRVPTAEEMAALEEELGATTIDLVVREGDRLSELHDQDSYSYKLANIYIAAADEAELQAKFDRCSEALRFDLEES